MPFKGTFLSEDTDDFVITPNRRTFVFPENLNFGDWKLFRNWGCLKVWKLKGLQGQEGHIWQARAALKITKIEIFSVSGKKNVRQFGVMTKPSVLSDKNVPLLLE